MTLAVGAMPDNLTVEEFMSLNPGGKELWQLVDGMPRQMVVNRMRQGLLASALGCVVGRHLKNTVDPFLVLPRIGVVPHVNARHDIRAPDLFVVRPDIPDDARWIAGPVLVAEVLSDGNRAETWSNVFALASIPEVQEIVVPHSLMVRADVLRRQPDGEWPGNPEAALEGDLVLDGIGFRTPLPDLHRNTRLRPGTVA